MRRLRTYVVIRPFDRLFDGLDPEQRLMAEKLLRASGRQMPATDARTPANGPLVGNLIVENWLGRPAGVEPATSPAVGFASHSRSLHRNRSARSTELRSRVHYAQTALALTRCSVDTGAGFPQLSQKI